MAMINVNRGAESLGVFSEEEVREGLRSGRFVPTDLGWREGMTTWQTLAQFPEFAEAIGTTAPGTGPTVAPGGEVLAPAAGVARSGLPWEHREQLGLVKAFSDTLIMVLTKPVEAFQVMRTEGGLVDPVLYAVIGGSLGFIVYLPLHAALRLIWNDGRATESARRNVRRGRSELIFVIIFCPIFIAISVIYRRRHYSSLLDVCWRREEIL